jgi:hypothetical protein
MLMASTRCIQMDLSEYGEISTAAWVLGCTEDQLVRVCSVEGTRAISPRPGSASKRSIDPTGKTTPLLAHRDFPHNSPISDQDLRRPRHHKTTLQAQNLRGAATVMGYERDGLTCRDESPRWP